MKHASSIQSVIRRGYADYRRFRRVRADVARAALRVSLCKTAALGGHVARCECGTTSSIHYNSCRHRSCPECSGGRRARWLEELRDDLLPCDHFHVIFTVPSELNAIWQHNRVLFAELLFKASRLSLEQLLRDPKYLGAVPGIISALHTWGRNLSIHPHVHCLVTGGGLGSNGQFHHLKRRILLPARVLMQMFRGKFRFYLRRALLSERLKLPQGMASNRFLSLLNRLGRMSWNVRVQDRYPHGASVAGYLARYMSGGPLSNKRIVSVTDEDVTFQYLDHRDGREKPLNLSLCDFLDRWFEHVPPKGLRTIRRSGLYSNHYRGVCESLREACSSPGAESEAEKIVDREVIYCPYCETAVICRELISAEQMIDLESLGVKTGVEPP